MSAEQDLADANRAIELYKEYIAKLEGEVAELRAELDARLPVVVPPPVVDPPQVVPPPVVPPVAKRTMYVGSSVQAVAPITQAAAIKTLEAKLGKLSVRREFDGNDIDATTLKAMLALDVGRARVYSFKGEASRLTDAILDLLPNDGFPTYMVYQHEVDAKNKNNVPATVVAKINLWITTIRTYVTRTGKKLIVPGVIYTTFLERDTANGKLDLSTNTADFFPTVPLGGVIPVFCGLDPYDPEGKKSCREQYIATLTAWRKAGGTVWGITETGTHRPTDAATAAWVKEAVHDAFEDGAVVLCWFWSNVGDHAGAGGWGLDGMPLAIAELKSHMPTVTG